ncbi:MAG: amidohydrolase [Myxococcota bacterium]
MNRTLFSVVVCASAACQSASSPSSKTTSTNIRDVFAAAATGRPVDSGSTPFISAPAQTNQTTKFDAPAVLAFVDARVEQTAKMAQQLWQWAEVGFQETKSSKLLQAALSKEGFSIQPNAADIPTAFVASYGQGRPVIALLAEFDALPGINQDALPVRSPRPQKDAGHACGHNLFGPGSVTAAIAVKDWLARTGRSGTVRLYGTPAEEGGSGKVYMVRAGLFRDVDATLHWHASDQNSAAARTTLANRSAKFRFHGVSAHAAGAPERARSALDGVEAFNHMVNLLREHIPQQSRIHYVITEGGKAPNVVPDFAEVFYYVRHPKAAEVQKIWTRVEAAAQGAAQGTGTRVEREIIHGNHPLLINETLARMVDDKLRQVGGIRYTAQSLPFVQKLHESLVNPRRALGQEEKIEPYEVALGYGSTDVGDVSIATPTAGLLIATWPPGTPAHSWQAVAASGHSSGFKGAHHAAKVLSLAAIELMVNPPLLAAAREEFQQRRGPNFKYVPLLGDREPPLDYRK